MKNKIMKSGAAVLFISTMASFGIASAYAYNPITAQLDPGARGYNVTNLQTFFADNSAIYPEGLITGYFGSMTKASVIRFQNTYGLAQVGRVGPQTITKVNDLIANGGWNGVGPISNNGDINAPMIYSFNQNISNTSATMNWQTNENAKAKVFYSTYPVIINEGDINSYGFSLVSGSVASSDDQLRSNAQVIINNLMPNTMYYYMVVSTDAAGNVSVYNVNNTFRTNQ